MEEMERCTYLSSRASVSQCNFCVSQPKPGYGYTFFPIVLPANQVVKNTILMHSVIVFFFTWLGG